MPDGDSVCRHHEALCRDIKGMIESQEKMNGTMQRVDKALGRGEVNFAVIKNDISLLKKIIFSAIGIILVGVLGAGLALILR